MDQPAEKEHMGLLEELVPVEYPLRSSYIPFLFSTYIPPNIVV